ncbi:hypothetical protein ACEXQE_09680 [Herbiconiux sp. P17]|uniref:hypothetical protein n=1 Tax=Herbiconiux wuyangfengii TaxID=3342794 RepID=UPI0035B83B73
MSPDDWVLDALPSHSSEPGGGLFPLALAADGDGGFWGRSGQTWVHVNEVGDIDAQLNYDPLPSPWETRSFDVIQGDDLIVTSTWADGDIMSDLLRISLDTGSSTTILHEENAMGDVAIDGEGIAYVSYDADSTQFKVKRMDPDSSSSVDLATFHGDGAEASLDVGPTHEIYVATPTERAVISSDGSIASAPQTSARPLVAVSDTGQAVWVTDNEDSDVPFVILNSSDAQRSLIDEHSTCGQSSLLLTTDREIDQGTVLPFLCEPFGIAWSSNSAFTVSIGDEGHAALVRASAPSQPAN